MLKARAPSWLYATASVFVLTLLFNAWQDAAFRGGGTGWVPAGGPTLGPALDVASVVPQSPMDQADVHAGDRLESIDDHPLIEIADWFVMRANFEQNRPMILQVRRGEQHLRLNFVPPVWRTWRDFVPRSFFAARLITLALAIFVAFSRPWENSARLAALMLAAAAVAEGYPAPGWAAALRHLPAVLAVPIGIATASWLLGGIAWLLFFAMYPRVTFNAPWRWGSALLFLVLFLPPLVASAITMIYAPSQMVGPWPHVSHLGEVAIAPNLFLRMWPVHQPVNGAWLLGLWCALTAACLVAGFVMVSVNACRCDDRNERRRSQILLIAALLLGIATSHNIVARNWNGWVGTPTPQLFSGWSYDVERLLFLAGLVIVAYAVVAKAQRRDENSVSLSGVQPP